MKLLLTLGIIMVFVCGVHAQSVIKNPITTTTVNARAEFMDAKYWSKLGDPDKTPHAFTLLSRNILPNPEGQYELWVKIVPVDLAAFTKKYDLPNNAAFVLQYATVDCSRHLLLLERTGVYDAANNRIGDGSSLLTPKSLRDRVKPGSIGAAVFENFCVRL